MTSVSGGPSRDLRVWISIGVVLALLGLTLVQIARDLVPSPDVLSEDHSAVPTVAAAALAVLFLIAFSVKRIVVETRPWLPWLTFTVSLVLGIGTWGSLAVGRPDVASVAYRGLQVPQGAIPFWDLDAVLRTMQCASQGFDVTDATNGCFEGVYNYGPGELWLARLPLPFHDWVAPLGVVAVVVSSLALWWLSRNSPGAGQVVLLVAAIGAPWQLLLERGNIDAAILWVACLVALLVRRRNTLGIWSLAALLIWILGTWKYYPFALGLMLLPALRIRRGWVVLVAYVSAVAAFLALSWQQLVASAASNEKFASLGDWVALGRLPLVERMGSPLLANLSIIMLTFAAAGWGVSAASRTRGRGSVLPAMLALGGSSVFLTPVLVAGFGWAYKAPLLLLSVPLLARGLSARSEVVAMSCLAILSLTAVTAFVVVNATLATLAALLAAGFSIGYASWILARQIVSQRKSHRTNPVKS